MTCWAIILGFMAGAAVLGFLLAIFIQPVPTNPVTAQIPKSGNDAQGSAANPQKTQRELEKIQKRYDELYDSKLNVDTALVAAESTLEGLKMDYERLERDMSNNNTRQKELQEQFDHYKDRKENEIKELKDKTKQATENYEKAKFKLAKSNRINEKLQQGLQQLKEENANLSTELEEAREEMDMVNASMEELNSDYKEIKEKANNYNVQLAQWQEKYESLNLSYENISTERESLAKNYEEQQATAKTEINELSAHLESLQAQLVQTEQYNSEYADAYDDLKARHIQANKELEEHKRRAADELAEIQKHFEGLEKDYEAIQQREAQLDDRYASLQDKHTDLEEAYLNTVEEKENLEEAYKVYKASAKEEYEAIELEAKSWLRKYEESHAELSNHQEIVEELEANKKNLMQELERTRERYNAEMSLSGGELEALSDTFENLKNKYFEVNKQLSSTQLEKERIAYQHEHLEEEMKGELQLMRSENKRLAQSLSKIKLQQYNASKEKAELLERIEQLEATGSGSMPPDQAKLVKIITRLRKDVQQQSQQLEQAQAQAIAYQQQIEQLQQRLHQQPSTALYATAEDDLAEIQGLSDAEVATLHDFGVYTFEQLALLSDDNKELLCQVLEQSEETIVAWMEAARERTEEE